jgi:hypothetical protein
MTDQEATQLVEFAANPHPPIKSGTYIPIDLDENNRYALEERAKRCPDQEFPPLGWGVCRHGHGLQDLPPLHERQARNLAERLNGNHPH